MIRTIVGFLKSIFGTTPTIEQPVSQVPTPVKLPFWETNEWPFPSPKPTNPEYLVGELIKGIEVEGEHAFFYWEGEKRRHIRTPKGTETMLARNVIWWMENRKVPIFANGLTTNCGEPKCVKLSHLVLNIPKVPYGPENLPQEPAKDGPSPDTSHVAKPRQKRTQPRRKRTEKSKPDFNDRLKCDSRKVYYPTERDARRSQAYFNSPEIRGNDPRQYVYECQQCDGWHLSKTNPVKFKQKVIGSW